MKKVLIQLNVETESEKEEIEYAIKRGLTMGLDYRHVAPPDKLSNFIIIIE